MQSFSENSCTCSNGRLIACAICSIVPSLIREWVSLANKENIACRKVRVVLSLQECVTVIKFEKKFINLVKNPKNSFDVTLV